MVDRVIDFDPMGGGSADTLRPETRLAVETIRLAVKAAIHDSLPAVIGEGESPLDVLTDVALAAWRLASWRVVQDSGYDDEARLVILITLTTKVPEIRLALRRALVLSNPRLAANRA